MATPTAFSYAQAAKGQAASTAAASAAQSTETLKDSVSLTNGGHFTADLNAVKSGSVDDETSRNTSIKAHLAAKLDTSSAQAGATVPNNTSAAASLIDSRRDDEDAATESSGRRSDKSVRSASASTRMTDDAEPKKGSRKPRKGKAGKESGEEPKKDKTAEQEKEQPKIELVEAPLPTVNIWTQRKETQAAKTSVTLPVNTASRSDANTTVAAEAWSSSQECKKKSKTTEISEAINGAVNGTKPQRKVGESDAAARRSGPRGSRLIERDIRTTEAPPPVGDVSSWPTPETAVKEAVKEEKRKPVEKTERPEAETLEESGPKGRTKDKWERMDFVPTVQFSTPIPSVRGSRGGRGGARGGRDVTTRGGHGAAALAAVDKPAGAATPSKTNPEARDRVRDGNTVARTASQPPIANKRASMDVSNSKDQRKSSAPVSGERVKESQPNATNEQAGSVRERGEGRGDRGRGGYRGRGGHPGNISMHSQHSSYMTNGASFGTQVPSRQYASPPLQQGGNFPPSYGGSQSRGGRGGRGQSNGSGVFRGVGGSSNGGRMRQVQTNMGQVHWDYAVPITPSAYPGWYEQARHILIPQLEYYFSIENLLKDEFLRKHMDSQGFVPLELVLGFSRVREAADPQTLRSIAAECTQLDYVVGDDNIERLRSRTHWQKFVYPNMEQRFESARTAGPQYFYPRSFHAMTPYANGMISDYSVASPASYPNGTENGYVAYPSDVAAVQASGMMNGSVSGVETQLSAQVPDFQPAISTEPAAETPESFLKSPPHVNGSAEAQNENAVMTNGSYSQPTEGLQS